MAAGSESRKEWLRKAKGVLEGLFAPAVRHGQSGPQVLIPNLVLPRSSSIATSVLLNTNPGPAQPSPGLLDASPTNRLLLPSTSRISGPTLPIRCQVNSSGLLRHNLRRVRSSALALQHL